MMRTSGNGYVMLPRPYMTEVTELLLVQLSGASDATLRSTCTDATRSTTSPQFGPR